MKNFPIRNLRRTALLGVALAGLAVSTAACGGDDDTSASTDATALVESILSAVRNGDGRAVEQILAAADPNLIAAAAPEIDRAMETGRVESAPTDPVTATVAPDDDVPLDEETDTPYPVDADASIDQNGGAVDLGSLADLPSGVDFGSFPQTPNFSDLGAVVAPSTPIDPSAIAGIVSAPATVDRVTFTGMPGVVRLNVTVREGGLGANDIRSVRVTYVLSGHQRVDELAHVGDVSSLVSTWSATLPLFDGMRITVVVTDAAGNETTYEGRVDIGIF